MRRCVNAVRTRRHLPALGAHRGSAMCRCPPQVWTSLQTLNGREFSFMLNSLIRDDAKLTDDVADQVPTGGGNSHSTRRVP